jgi:hypothetical protein
VREDSGAGTVKRCAAFHQLKQAGLKNQVLQKGLQKGLAAHG